MANLGYLQLTRGCVQSCRFCSNPPTGQELSEQQMRAEIDHLVELRYDGVILTGGEPTTSALLLPALRYASERGLQSRIITNGQLLADRAFFAECVEQGLCHIHVSFHSYRPEVHDFITRNAGSWDRVVACLALAPELGVYCDVNSVINTYNADHLHESVIWICSEFPFIRHFVWNNMDPEGNRAEENPDCIARHHEFQISLELAMEFLQRTGRSFRAERVPLCFMRRFAWASTETRKIIKEEERLIRFLDDKGLVRQLEFLHGKGDACDVCRFDPICAGMYSMANHYDERELSPVFEDPRPVIGTVLGCAPSPELLERIEARRGRRSPTEQPDEERRATFRASKG
ncbi:MAG: radical SAM protein [Deltaproteobacteria bacterium]|jgi:MoaA/NifB/PqqE/SkfB family radical SAM enzyme|nr:radical SAM protein [Deltaproteobacteria bacterium]MBW2533155.1 radical SAM protein [Deltaproteobacteria bacterium]